MFEAFDLSHNDVLMTVFPAFGRVGYAWILAGVMFGARNVIMNFSPTEVLQTIGSERVSIVNLVATMGAMLLAEPGLKERDLSSLRGLVFAGSVFPATLREKVQAQLCSEIYEYYGMQETGALTVSTPEDRRFRPESIGTPLAFADVYIERADGGVAAPGDLGETAGRTPETIPSHFNNPEKTQETFRGGYVHTGDLGMMDEEGFVFIKGRIKDMIVSGGQNVHAAEIEEILLGLDGVADCAVFGLPDELWGERVSVLVVRGGASGETLTAEAVETHCRSRLAGPIRAPSCSTRTAATDTDRKGAEVPAGGALCGIVTPFALPGQAAARSPKNDRLRPSYPRPS